MALTQTIEKAQCSEHGEYDSTVISFGVKRMAQPCPLCLRGKAEERRNADAVRLAEEAQRAHRAHVIELFGNACLPLRFKEKTFSNYSTGAIPAQLRAAKVAKAYSEKFAERIAKGGGLVMCGKPGTGKTHLAAAIANHIIPLGYSVVFRSVLQAVRSVKETYSKLSEITEAQALERLHHPQLLILDEVGVQFGSDAERMILFEIINGRYEMMRPTILISNLNEKEIGGYLGERILDRMCEGGGVVLAFDWESHRRSA